MADKSAIEWTDATWSPVTGCDPISTGCKHCYAKREVEIRWSKNPKSEWFGRPFNDVRCHPEKLAGARSPLAWKRPRRIFVCPRADLFHEKVSGDFIMQVFGVMARCPQHTFQVLTKRAARMHEVVTYGLPFGRSDFPLPNVWIGVSVEDHAAADERIPLLLQTPAAVRWVSAEPLLGPVDLVEAFDSVPSLDWVVAGGESGPKARPMHPDWVRSLRDQCAEAGVPFLFKQWGEFAPNWLNNDAGKKIAGSEWMDRMGKKAAGRLLDGVLHDEYPEVLP